MSKQLYNIALVPIESNFVENLIKYAQEKFLKYQNGYILSNNAALPHITLCHFYSNYEDLVLIWQLIAKEFIDTYLIEFDGVYLNTGSNEHKGSIWSGLTMRRQAKIDQLQARICEVLSIHSYKSLTSTGESYFPHLTFARLQNNPALKYQYENFFTKSYLFKGSLGVSNKIGE